MTACVKLQLRELKESDTIECLPYFSNPVADTIGAWQHWQRMDASVTMASFMKKPPEKGNSSATKRGTIKTAVSKGSTLAESKHDKEYEAIKLKINALTIDQKRGQQALVRNWLRKLNEPTTVSVWKRLRNKYAHSLLNQMEKKVASFQEPFNKNPPPQLENISFLRSTKKRPVSDSTRPRDTIPLKTSTSETSEAVISRKKATEVQSPGISAEPTEAQRTPPKRKQVSVKSLGLTTIADKKVLQQTKLLKEEKTKLEEELARLEEKTDAIRNKWKAKAMQMQVVLDAQKVRIEFLERDNAELRASAKYDKERSEMFFKAEIRRLKKKHQAEINTLPKNKQLHPAEIELAKSVNIDFAHAARAELGSTSPNNHSRFSKTLRPSMSHMAPQNRFTAQTDKASQLQLADLVATATKSTLQINPVVGTQSHVSYDEAIDKKQDFLKYLSEFTKNAQHITDAFRSENGLDPHTPMIQALSYQRYSPEKKTPPK